MRAGIEERELVVIGGGPAGMAAACAARQAGVEDVLLVERDSYLGGILPQCIHDGFGNVIFGEMLTGPQYAQRFSDMVAGLGIAVRLDSMVLSISPDKRVTYVNSTEGLVEVQARAIILAMGCRERTRGQIRLPGTRPAGVLTAGCAQRYVNIEGLLPGTKAVILGSGDVGLIMARRLTLEGVEVEGVYEIMPAPGGLARNIAQCLEDYGIPLYLSHTIVQIHGAKRVEGVTVARVDDKWRPIPGTERFVPCDTVVLSVGLIPENELSRGAGIELDPVTGGPVVDEGMETSIAGIFAAGNVVHVHDLVDHVSRAGEVAGRAADAYLRGERPRARPPVGVRSGENVAYVVPQRIYTEQVREDVTFYLRVRRPEKKVRLVVRDGEGEEIARKTLSVVRPPEMVSITVDKDRLRGGSGLEISVEKR